MRANGVVLDRLTRYKRLEQYPDDTDLLDDVIVENRQAIEMTTIYRDIINGTRELMSSVLDNRLNNVMKILTIVTLVMGIPTLISGIYGMNVSSKWMPLADTPHGFSIICLLIVFICMIAMFLLKKRKCFSRLGLHDSNVSGNKKSKASAGFAFLFLENFHPVQFILQRDKLHIWRSLLS